MRSGISAASFEQDIFRIKALTKITHYNVEIKRRNISLTGGCGRFMLKLPRTPTLQEICSGTYWHQPRSIRTTIPVPEKCDSLATAYRCAIPMAPGQE
jgi:hypothetical protein